MILRKGVLLIIALITAQLMYGQIAIQKSSEVSQYTSELSDQFKNFKLVKLDANKLLEDLKDFDGVHHVNLEVDNNETWPLEIVPANTLVEDMQIHTASGEDYTDEVKVYPYSGHVMNASSSEVRLTVGKDFIYGYIQDKDFNRFVEPLQHIIKSAPKDLYIVYNGDDVIFPEGSTCASTHMKKKSNEVKNSGQMKSTGLCFEVEVSTASDWLMFQAYGQNVTTLTNHNVGVMNNVQGNYDDEFDDEILFVLVEQWISNCSTCDPWTANTAAGTLLNSFRSWGPNGFAQVHDIGQLWTDRDFDGSTIGIAYVGVVCTGSRYQCLQDFSSNANLKRVMVAHETGHNFDAVQSTSGHDPQGSAFIMAPSVSNVTAWSAQSIADVEAHYLSRNCLANCAPPAPPIASFSSDLSDICPGTTVQFFDNSTSTPTSWSWSFPGGTPGNSTLENPTVTYNTIGSYNVTLTATNVSGSNTVSIPGYITVSNSGTEVVLTDNFAMNLNNWTVTNPDNSTTWTTASVPGSTGNATVAWIDNYNYSDGVGDLDGLESQVVDLTGRTDVNLELEYAFSRYNSSNSDIFRIKVSTNGGASFPTTVFTGQENGSGNFATVGDMTAAFTPSDVNDWCIASSTNANCLSIDLSQFNGESNVVILLENESDYGNNLFIDNVLLTSSCQVIAPPFTQFTSNVTAGCAPLTVQYQDLSTNAPTGWSWSFPGGTPASSTQQNPIVTYNESGMFDVTLIATNAAGSNTFSISDYITVLDVPVASFSSSNTGQTVFFTNTSQDATFYSWNFGDNTSSTEENPVHQYDEDGTYLVVLTAGNVCGTNTFTFQIDVNSLPTAGFSQDLTSGCATLIVSYQNQSSDNADTYLWTFEGGIPATSTLVNPIVSYENSGIFDVSLIAYNETGENEFSQIDLIEVFDVPIAAFDAFEDGFDVVFTNLSTDATSYLWNFGDNGTSTEVNPSHSYTEDGEFIVTLTATNSCGSMVFTSTINISNLPNAAFSSNVTAGCEDLVVQFQDMSSSNVDSWLWSFPGGNPSTSTQQNPIVTYEDPGTFDVSLIVTNENGSDNSFFANYVTVLSSPTAGFAFSNNQLVYNFSSTSTNANTYSWDFGDNTTSNLENPVHIYDQDGMYTVILVVTNSCGTNEFISVINVVSSVVAGATASVTFGCADLTVQFSDNSSSNTTDWQWNFPGGNPSSSTQQNPVVNYTQAGIFDVSLVVSNSEFQDEISFSEYIIVTDVPDSDFAFDISELIVNFDNNTVNGTSYFWNFGDNQTSNQLDPTHSYSVEGVYQVMMIATNACGSDTTILEVNVSSLPTANFSSNIQAGCADFSVLFSDLSTSNTTEWQWTFEGGNPSSSTTQNPVISYSEAGTYDVTLVAINPQGQDEYILQDYIVVATTPIVGFSQTSDGGSVNFEATSSNTDSYEWTVAGLQGIHTGANPSIDFPADGVYSVTVKATNGCGTTTSILTVVITAYPDAEFSSQTTMGCSELDVTFIDESLDEPTTWKWTLEGATPNVSIEENPIVTYETAGIYSVELIVSNAVGSDTVNTEAYITVLSSPVASFESDIMGNVVEFTNNSQDAISYLWNFGDMNTSMEENPSHEYLLAGEYEVTLIVDNGQCQDTLMRKVITIVDGLEDELEIDVLLYPIPTSNILYLELENSSHRSLKYDIINPIGQIIQSGNLKVSAGNNIFQFDTAFNSGLYFMKLSEGNMTYVKRFIVQN